MSVTVRRATKADAGHVAKLAVDLIDQHREYDALRFAKLYDAAQAERFYGERAEDKESAIFVAEIENEIVGMAFLEYEKIDYAEMLENAVWIHDIFVRPTQRGSGAGRMLMDAAAEWAKSTGAAKLMLTVADRNDSAREFFQGRGFQPTMIEMMLGLRDEDKSVSG